MWRGGKKPVPQVLSKIYFPIQDRTELGKTIQEGAFMKKELSTTEMFYGILNQRGIAMLIEQALMVACVKIAGIEASIVSLLAVSITLWLPTIVFVIIWELILRPDAIKRLPDFAGQPTAFSGSFSERWHQFCELSFRQRLILVCMAVECVLTGA